MSQLSILIAALSGRAAAMAARRAGFAPHVADIFADEDTLAIAGAARRVAGDVASGFDEADLLGTLEALAAEMPERPIGVAYGAGFEHRPDLLRRIAARWPLLGNTPETVEAVKNPWRFAQTLAEHGIPHPEIAPVMAGPPPSGWLIKRQGGAGGVHISPIPAFGEGLPPPGVSHYRQRQVAGRAISALFVASAAGARIVGFSEQWTAPSPGEPFRFGGALSPADISPTIAGRLADAVKQLTLSFGLVGLNGADFIVGPEGWWLLEINPRLGATLDIFDSAGGALFKAHMASLAGTAPRVEQPAGARALQIVYAPAPISDVPPLDWPPWSADRPPAGAFISRQAPCCTVLASAETACEALRLCQERVDNILKLMGVECRRAS